MLAVQLTSPLPPTGTLPLALVPMQAYTDRSITAERRIRVLEEARLKEEIRRSLENPRAGAHDLSTEEILRHLVDRLDHEDPSTSVQSYCASVLKQVADPLSGKGSLS